MNLPTAKEVLAAYLTFDLADNCVKGAECPRCAFITELQTSGELCNLYLACALHPHLIPNLLADGIRIGLAIAEQRQLEELIKL